MTADWICPLCRSRDPGNGQPCITCGLCARAKRVTPSVALQRLADAFDSTEENEELKARVAELESLLLEVTEHHDVWRERARALASKLAAAETMGSLANACAQGAMLQRAFNLGDKYGCEISRSQPRYERLWAPGRGVEAP